MEEGCCWKHVRKQLQEGKSGGVKVETRKDKCDIGT